MTDEQFNAWLTSPASIRCLLVEVVASVAGVEMTRYLSSAGYVTGAADTPANTAYLPLVLGGVKFAETLSLDKADLSYGDVELDNTSGMLDPWLEDIWANRAIRMYTGDVRWPRAYFRMVFNGVVADIASKSRTRVNLKLRDMLQRLNTPVTDMTLGGSTQNKGMLIPLLFGEVHNMTPLLIDPVLHTYQVHQGQINKIIEVRDSGAPVSTINDVMEGKFALSGSPAGAITVSAQGHKTPLGAWPITVAPIIKILATEFGKEADRLTADDFDADNFASFDAAHPQPVGICMTDRVNVLEACQRLARSVGAQITASRQGQIRLLKLQFPGTGTEPFEIGPSDMLAQNIAISARSEVAGAIKLGYCKNWTVQTGLQTGILEAHKNRFATEWDAVVAQDSDIAEAYGLHVEPVQRDTMLLRKVEAEPEAYRLLEMASVPRTTYRFEGLSRLLLLELGQAVNLTHPRFGLQDGVAGVVVGLTPDWITGRIVVEIMV
jgi:hypothetical protein